MVASLLLVPFSSAQLQQSLTCLLLIVTQCHFFGRVFRLRWSLFSFLLVEFVFFPGQFLHELRDFATHAGL